MAYSTYQLPNRDKKVEYLALFFKEVIIFINLPLPIWKTCIFPWHKAVEQNFLTELVDNQYLHNQISRYDTVINVAW